MRFQIYLIFTTIHTPYNTFFPVFLGPFPTLPQSFVKIFFFLCFPANKLTGKRNLPGEGKNSLLHFAACRRRTGSSDVAPHSPAPSQSHRPASPEGSQVNIMGVHTVPGSPNTLHRTVATNTPPSPALQRRLGQASPSLARHPPPVGTNRDGVPSSPLIGRNPKTAAPGVPPSPLMGRRMATSSHSTPDDLSTQPPSMPTFPVSPQLPEKRHMSSGDVERTENKNMIAGGSNVPNLSGTHTLPDISKSIYGET